MTDTGTLTDSIVLAQLNDHSAFHILPLPESIYNICWHVHCIKWLFTGSKVTSTITVLASTDGNQYDTYMHQCIMHHYNNGIVAKLCFQFG